jgi:hypothetical protein
MPRAVRKWFAAHTDAPADLLVWVNEPVESRTSGQSAMAKGCDTVWREVMPLVVASGVLVISP